MNQAGKHSPARKLSQANGSRGSHNANAARIRVTFPMRMCAAPERYVQLLNVTLE